MSKREEILDMAVHALTPLMNGDKAATAADLFDASIDIAEKLIAKVEATAALDGTPPRDELMDMGIHAMSALLNGRGTADVDGLLDECMAVAQSLIRKVDAALPADADDAAREELLDMAVHVQTALLNARPKMAPDDLSDQCVLTAQKMIARVDG